MIKTASLLGKRGPTYVPRYRSDIIQRMKSENKCRGFNETGHWFRDRQECSLKFQEKYRSHRMDGTHECRKSKDYNGKGHVVNDKTVTAFFRPGGQ